MTVLIDLHLTHTQWVCVFEWVSVWEKITSPNFEAATTTATAAATTATVAMWLWHAFSHWPCNLCCQAFQLILPMHQHFSQHLLYYKTTHIICRLEICWLLQIVTDIQLQKSNSKSRLVLEYVKQSFTIK